MTDDVAATPEEDAPEHSLVEIAPGFGVLFGPSVPDGFEMLKSPIVPDRASDDIWSVVSPLIGAANLAAQANMAHASVQGLVRLTPETLEWLKFARPLTSGGENLGVLVGQSGKFSHVVRWVPAGDVATAGQLSSVGPALALLAIQAQLAEMKSLMQDNIQLTQAVLKEIRNERWASASALRETLGHALEEAQAIGGVTAGVWQNIAGLDDDLRKERKRDRRAVDDHVNALANQKSHVDRQKFLAEHGDAILADLLSLVAVQQASFIYQGLRAGYLYEGTETTPANDALIAHIVETTQVDWKKSTADVYQLAATLHQQFATFADLPGNRAMPVGRAHNARKKVSDTSREFLERLDVLEKEIGYTPRERPDAQIQLLKGDRRARAAESLRWELEDSEELHAVAIGDALGAFSGDRYLGITQERILVARASEVDRHGGPWHAFRTNDIRYVKSAVDEKGKTVTLDVYMPEDELHLKLEVPAAAETGRSDAETLIQLVRSFMNLPSKEIPQSPVGAVKPENDLVSVEPTPSPELLGS